MEKAYDGRQVVGMDLHRRRSVLVRMTEDGRRLGMARITNSPQELRREIARAGKSPKVVLEATYGWYWAADTLMAAGAEVHLASDDGSLGYKGVQIPTWDARLFDLKKASSSKTYCDEVKGICKDAGVEITELSTHLQGQLVAVHPAYDEAFDGFAPAAVRGNRAARQEWAVDQLTKAALASQRLGLTAHATFSGALAWPYVYPWPQRPPGLIETAFDTLAARWRPILDAFDAAGVDLCFEIHPGEDLHDGASFEMFLTRVGNHRRCKILYDPSHFVLQQLDYLGFIDAYHTRIGAFHVKDAEFNPNARQGVYGGYQSWVERAGRFRSLGDGQVDFRGIFSKLAQYGFDGWAVLEWECAIKSAEQGAREGAPFIRNHLIEVTQKAFDDFAAAGTDDAANRRMLGLD
jgi:sugar phosphate isomerase/epimerase